MAKAPRKRTRTLYRGVQQGGTGASGQPVEAWASQEAHLGEKVTFDGYQSTSSSFSIASETYASDDSSVIFEIRTPEGVNLTSISSYQEEQEVLLPRKSTYVIVGKHDVIRPTGRTATIIQMVAVNSDNEVLNGSNQSHPEPLRRKKSWLSSLFGE